MPRSEPKPGPPLVPPHRLPLGRRVLLVLAVFLLAWSWSFWRSFDAARLPGPAAPESWFVRYQPLREPLRGVLRADLFAAPPAPEDPQLVFWAVQYTVAPTVLQRLYEPEQALKRSWQVDPHHLVVELPTRDAFLRFADEIQAEAVRHGKAVRVHDLGNGVGLIETRGGG